MELWAGKAKKAGECQYCDRMIVKGDEVMQGRARKRKGRPWPKPLRWHVECWYTGSKEYICRSDDQRERVITQRLGRPRMTLVDEDRRRRFLVIRRFNTLHHRQKAAIGVLVESGVLDEVVLSRVHRLTVKMRECASDAEKLGGIPGTWVGILGLSTAEPTQGPVIVDMEPTNASIVSVEITSPAIS